MVDHREDFVQLARLALGQRPDDVHAFLRKIVSRAGKSDPDLAERLRGLLATASQAMPTRAASSNPLPVDMDSRLELLRVEGPVSLEVEPVWAKAVASQLNAVVEERRREQELLDAGLTPSRSLLFTGSP